MLMDADLSTTTFYLHELLPCQTSQRVPKGQDGQEIVSTHWEYSYGQHTYQKRQRKMINFLSSSEKWENLVIAGNHVRHSFWNSDRPTHKSRYRTHCTNQREHYISSLYGVNCIDKKHTLIGPLLFAET